MNLLNATREQCKAFYKKVGKEGGLSDLRYLAAHDLYFLLCFVMNRPDADHPFLYQCIREFEAAPDGYLDLWARDHYKSTIITFAGTIQEILKNPEITCGIFSHTRPIATGFTRQIKQEFESNKLLQDLFPHVVPPVGKESRPWGADAFSVKRKTNPKEQTVEAHGVVDGQPISKHFMLRVYDDLVTSDSVTNPEKIIKTTDQFVLSENLGTRGGRARAIGTRYHHNDTYATLIDRGAFKPRIKAATKNGEATGEPVFLTPEDLEKKLRTMGSYIFGCQMLQKPSPDEGSIFQKDWLKFWTVLPKRFDRMLISMDCAFKDTKASDYVVAQAWGLCGADAYLVDQIRDKWSFTNTVKEFVKFCKKWPEAYEKLIEDKANGPAVIDTLNKSIAGIIPVEPFGSKVARAHAVSPFFESGNVYLPTEAFAPWVSDYILELLQFPVVGNDDQVDTTTQLLQRVFKHRPMTINPAIFEKKSAQFNPVLANIIEDSPEVYEGMII